MHPLSNTTLPEMRSLCTRRLVQSPARVLGVPHRGNWAAATLPVQPKPELTFARLHAQAFRDPAEFTVCLTGAVEEEVLLPLLQQYLGSIPAADAGSSPRARRPADVTPLPFAFPEQPVREDVKCEQILIGSSQRQ